MITERDCAKLPNEITPNYRKFFVQITEWINPSFLMVLTGTGGFAYRREEDGVLVVPVGCLGN